MPRGRKARSKKPKDTYYFADDQQWAVKEYKASDDYDYKNWLFNKYLYKPFQQMIAAILRRYQFNLGRYSHEELEIMAMTQLVNKFTHFDEWKPSPLHDEITYTAFKGTFERKMVFNTDEKGRFASFESSDCPEDFIEYANKNLVGVDTIYPNESLECRLKFRETAKKKKVYVYVPHKQYNGKFLVDYYYANAEDIGDEDLEFRMGKLRDYLYMPADKERNSFSYCQTIVKNFFNTHSRKASEAEMKNLTYAYAKQESDPMRSDSLPEGYYYADAKPEKEVYDEFIDTIVEELRMHTTSEFITDAERKVGFALADVLEDWDTMVPEFTQKGNPASDKHRRDTMMKTIQQYSGLSSNMVKEVMKIYTELFYKIKEERFPDLENDII